MKDRKSVVTESGDAENVKSNRGLEQLRGRSEAGHQQEGRCRYPDPLHLNTKVAGCTDTRYSHACCKVHFRCGDIFCMATVPMVRAPGRGWKTHVAREIKDEMR